MPRSLCEFNTLTFDCYGTLIDWESGIWDALQPVLMKNNGDRISRKAALAVFARQEFQHQSETPHLAYPEILKRVHIGICRELDLATTSPLNDQFGNSVDQWPAFADTADALRLLKHHYKLVILSNVHRQGFASSNNKLGVTFDAIYTAEDIGSYKPNPDNFTYMLDRLKRDHGIDGSTILHTAQSLFHDHIPAREAGLHSAWIDRQGLSDSENWGATMRVAKRPHPDYIFPTMKAMAQARQNA